MYLSAPKRFSVIFAYIVVIILVGSLILSIAFHVENPWLWVAIFSVLTVPLLYAKISELPYLKWKNSYYVGVEEIDYDHKQLVSLINQVVTASQDHLAENIVPNILDELIDYTKYHLRREEKLMEEYEYPERVKHAAQHVKFHIEGLILRLSGEQISSMILSSNQEYRGIRDGVSLWKPYGLQHRVSFCLGDEISL